MRNDIDRNCAKGPALLGSLLLFALLGAASLAAQNPNPADMAQSDTPVRIAISARVTGLRSGTRDIELEFGANEGKVTRLSATNGRQTFKFERVDDAGLSCPSGRVKECDSLSLRGGGQLTACACVAPGPVTQTKEHILLAKQVSVPSLMTEGSRPEQLAADATSSDRSYEVALSDKTMLRATTGGGQTCWLNKKIPMNLCY